MYSKYPPYFLQTVEWLDYWKQANQAGHDYLEIRQTAYIQLAHIASTQQTLSIELSFFVYQYPWQLKQSFWYIPKAPVFKFQLQGQILPLDDLLKTASLEFEQELQHILKSILQKALLETITKAGKQKIVFIKVDFEDSFTNFLEIQDNLELLNTLQSSLDGKARAEISKKTIQYLEFMVLEDFAPHTMDLVAMDFTQPGLMDWFEQTKIFWSKTNENIRRYTKKSLQKNWQVSTAKTQVNFEAFWKVYQSTSSRQSFFTNSKAILETLFEKDFSRLIILRDSENGEPQSVWFGIVSENTLTYLYGGNTDLAFKNYGQYLIHLVALKIAATENLPFYDLGRYDNSKGYGKFKEGYRGTIRSFLGPVDLILSPVKFASTNLLIKIAKFFRI